jgi:hypothetical protein
MPTCLKGVDDIHIWPVDKPMGHTYITSWADAIT